MNWKKRDINIIHNNILKNANDMFDNNFVNFQLTKV
jgi:hypothetical protein